jgi:hypothetical protein
LDQRDLIVNELEAALVLLLHEEPTNMTLQLDDGDSGGLIPSGVVMTEVRSLDTQTALPKTEIPPLSNKSTVVSLDETDHGEDVIVALTEGDLGEISSPLGLQLDDLAE